MARRAQPNYGVAVLAGVLAWVIPGAGHVYLRRNLRGGIIFVCINLLFWSGIAMGGVFTVEPIRQRWWLMAQLATGASGGTGWYLQEQRRKTITAELDLPPRPSGRDESVRRWWRKYTAGLAAKKLALVYPAEQVARAYTGIAGMLNLLCIFDAVMLALIGRLGEPPPQPRAPPREVQP